uniref:Methyl-accepting chemotaxis sensory transducer with Pas/Pac sensor n=1 Tax=Rhodopseudomonas palustris (strain BisA53) TaxID=316055 RepID=Q07IN3_RHOP5
MRNNQPVTNNEYVLPDDTLIVSKTDTKGKLTYFNEQFVEASGFSEAELMGQPHNIVRHPDMPAAAFQNLWDTIKAGRPWTGAVKNRRKNGDYYWVQASATPIWEKGQIAGYMSVRTKLVAELRDQAQRAYAQINQGQASGVRVDDGIIRNNSLLDLFAPLTRTLRARLTTLIVVQAFCMVVAGVAGIMATSPVVSIGLTAGGLLLGAWLGIAAMRAILGPMGRLNAAMVNIFQGQFNSRIAIDRDDEIGVALRNVQAMQNKLAFDREQQQDMARKATEQRKLDMNRIAGEFESAVGEIIETVSSASIELEASAGTLTSSAERSQQLTVAVAAASEQASTNVQSVASATEELTSSVNEISRQVQESARIAHEAVGQAHQTNHSVGELSEAAGRIGAVVELISNIAGQTNLLALNATIEAARAGEAGRGFAVVASEVKALAEQTAKATGEISQQIASIQTATTQSVGAISAITGTINRMSEIAATIASAVEEQGAATQEIARNVQQAAQGTMQVSSNITDVQRGASETGSASSQVLSSAQALAQDSNRLKTEVGRFLNSVRAA